MLLLLAGLAAQALTGQQVVDIINAQARDKITDPGAVRYVAVNLDNDTALEVVARVQGAVHLRQFFVLDPLGGNRYRLIAERAWNVVRWNLSVPEEVAGTRLFTVVERTGGTGLDSEIAHLWYVSRGAFVEAWQGVLSEYRGQFQQVQRILGGFRIDPGQRQLRYWHTVDRLDLETAVSIHNSATTTSTLYVFDGTRFVTPGASAEATLEAFLQARIAQNPAAALRLSTPTLQAPEGILLGPANPHYQSYRIEQLITGDGAGQAQVVLLLGNAQSLVRLQREAITLEEADHAWRVHSLRVLETIDAGALTVPGADAASLAQLRGFLDARVRRDIDAVFPFLAPALRQRLDDEAFRLLLIGISNPHLATYDILRADAHDNAVSYQILLHEATTSDGLVATRPERITLEQIDGQYLVTVIDADVPER